MAKVERNKVITALHKKGTDANVISKNKSGLSKKVPPVKSGETNIFGAKTKPTGQKIAMKVSNNASTASDMSANKTTKVKKINSKPKKKEAPKISEATLGTVSENLPNTPSIVKSETNTAPVKKPEPDPEATVFVGNVNPNTKRKQLEVLFEKFGKVMSVRFRTIDGKKIFKQDVRKQAEALNAYVVMENVECARKALELSGTEFKGRHIRVNPATNFMTAIDPKRVIFIGNLKYSATDEKLYEIFSVCGDVEYVRTLRNDKGCTGVAYVCYKSPEAVPLALELNNSMLDDRPIRVNRYVKHEITTRNLRALREKTPTGAERRIIKKNKSKSTIQTNKVSLPKAGDTAISAKIPKKSDFHGVKTGLKKTVKKKKTVKTTGPLKTLAKKIAPKT